MSVFRRFYTHWQRFLDEMRMINPQTLVQINRTQRKAWQGIVKHICWGLCTVNLDVTLITFRAVFVQSAMLIRMCKRIRLMRTTSSDTACRCYPVYLIWATSAFVWIYRNLIDYSRRNYSGHERPPQHFCQNSRNVIATATYVYTYDIYLFSRQQDVIVSNDLQHTFVLETCIPTDVTNWTRKLRHEGQN